VSIDIWNLEKNQSIILYQIENLHVVIILKFWTDNEIKDMLFSLGLGQKPPDKKPPNNELYKLFIYLYLCTHFGLVVLLAIYGFKLFLNTIFHNKLLLELEDIINNWNICLRIIITLIKESKNKIIKLVFFLNKIIIVYQTGWENNSLITFNNFKGYKCNNNCLSVKTIPD
jgi:hypothetical protein